MRESFRSIEPEQSKTEKIIKVNFHINIIFESVQANHLFNCVNNDHHHRKINN